MSRSISVVIFSASLLTELCICIFDQTNGGLNKALPWQPTLQGTGMKKNLKWTLNYLNGTSSLMIKFRSHHVFFFSMEDARALKTGSSKNILTMSDCNSILTPVFKGNLFPSVVKEKI